MKDWWEKHSAEEEDDDDQAFNFEQSVKKLKKSDLSGDFPARVVIDAYLKPQIDESTDKFVFSVPDLTGLREYLREKLSWPSAKTDETLLPVLKRMDLLGVSTPTRPRFSRTVPVEKSERV
jgi:DNA excision repair protein ERCC-5